MTPAISQIEEKLQFVFIWDWPWLNTGTTLSTKNMDFLILRTKGGNDLSALIDFELKCSHLTVKGNFSSLPSHSFVCFCLSLNWNFVSIDTLWYFILCQVQTATFSLKKFEMLKISLGRNLMVGPEARPVGNHWFKVHLCTFWWLECTYVNHYNLVSFIGTKQSFLKSTMPVKIQSQWKYTICPEVYSYMFINKLW